VWVNHVVLGQLENPSPGAAALASEMTRAQDDGSRVVFECRESGLGEEMLEVLPLRDFPQRLDARRQDTGSRSACTPARCRQDLVGAPIVEQLLEVLFLDACHSSQ
jgi:hypothetical protein